MKPATLGSISHGTLKSDDLINAFHDELEWQINRQDRTPENRDELDRLNAIYGRISDECWDDNGDFVETEFDGEIIAELEDALNCFAPAYCYFGSHPGDGSDFGYWVSENIQEDFDGLQVSDLSEVPNDYAGEVMHVSDHGNIEIYSVIDGKFTSILAVV